MIVGLE